MHLHPDVHKNLEEVARALEGFDEDFIFVGGAVVGLLLSDKAAPPARFTQDIDVIVSDMARHGYTKMEEELRKAGFIPHENVICRWHIAGILVDIMPVDEAILGFSNHWYKKLWKHAITFQLVSGKTIQIVSSPYLIATKLSAFYSRGNQDYLFSHDMEDIIILLDGRPELVQEVRDADTKVKTFIQQEFKELLANPAFTEAISGHLHGDALSQQRRDIILARMQEVVHS